MLALTGKHKKDLEKYCEQVISVPANNTSRIQEMHIMLGQMLCNAIEFKLGLAPLVIEEKVSTHIFIKLKVRISKMKNNVYTHKIIFLL